MTIRNVYDRLSIEDCEDGYTMEMKEVLIELRTSTGMNRREFAEYFMIPYRTMQDWELGNRKMPDYLLRLMAYKIKNEQEKITCQKEGVQ